MKITKVKGLLKGKKLFFVLTDFDIGGPILAVALKDRKGYYHKFVDHMELRPPVLDLIPGICDDAIIFVSCEKMEEIECSSLLTVEDSAREVLSKGRREGWGKYAVTLW